MRQSNSKEGRFRKHRYSKEQPDADMNAGAKHHGHFVDLQIFRDQVSEDWKSRANLKFLA